MSSAEESRFWSYVIPEPNTGCWLWAGQYNSKGYGRLAVGSNRSGRWRRVLAHKMSFEMKFGKVPGGLELDHRCNVTACVNPDHLEPVSHAENIRRSRLGNVETNPAAKIQRDKTHCWRGHPLTEDNVYFYTKGSKTKRNCRACMRVRAQLRRAAS